MTPTGMRIAEYICEAERIVLYSEIGRLLGMLTNQLGAPSRASVEIVRLRVSRVWTLWWSEMRTDYQAQGSERMGCK